jgi:uncharacterized SAM-binding protein YcdF (DUF218 family)
MNHIREFVGEGGQFSVSDRRSVTEIRAGRSRIRRRLFVAFLLLAVWSLLAWAGARWLVVEAPLGRADAMVVLSGSGTYFERAQEAAALFKEGRLPKIVLTNDNRQGGWSSVEQRNPFFYERATSVLTSAGVPKSAIEVIPQPVQSTRDEARLLRAYADEHGLHSILFVTSAYHSRRALWTLRREFRNTKTEIGLVSVPPGNQTPSPATWWLHLRGWEMVPGEYLKIVYYWLRY